jgi:cell fate (sporulation/competence/biofilm development) regulator YmcA (YheA/YmcA/DUF963 family)
MKKIWNYLTPEEILNFYKQIESMCEDPEKIIDKMYELELKGQKDPVGFVSAWLGKYCVYTEC